MNKYFSILILLAGISLPAISQDIKQDHITADNLRKTIGFLADDKLEGRRTGTAGEKLAYKFIESEFKKAKLKPLFNETGFIQSFNVNDGREIGSKTKLTLDNKKYVADSLFFPFAFSADTKSQSFYTGAKKTFIYDIAGVLKENVNNPHFDLKANIIDKVQQAQNTDAVIFIVTNSSSQNDGLSFEAKDKTARFRIPVIYIRNLKVSDVKNQITVQVNEKNRTGHNVAGMIDNKALYTIILGAHYDHLGYGEDHNSLYSGKTPMIHNGADDNASGTAALIELAKELQSFGYKKYNYIFTAFSGEELGLFGSKYFTEHAGFDLKNVNYMINMDMVGRLNDSTHAITIGGYGTSPSWGKLITDNQFLKINKDSSGSGPSDHTSFYRKDIPVLFFFTGSHKDYHKPSDDADKINYDGEVKVIRYITDLIAKTNETDKLVFTKTREVSMGKSSFKVSLGIMPDYTYSGTGVRVDGVSENKAAQKAGILTGDVLLQLGEHSFTDVQSYMDALNKFNKGESTKVKLSRGKEIIILPVTF